MKNKKFLVGWLVIVLLILSWYPSIVALDFDTSYDAGDTIPAGVLVVLPHINGEPGDWYCDGFTELEFLGGIGYHTMVTETHYVKYPDKESGPNTEGSSRTSIWWYGFVIPWILYSQYTFTPEFYKVEYWANVSVDDSFSQYVHHTFYGGADDNDELNATCTYSSQNEIISNSVYVDNMTTQLNNTNILIEVYAVPMPWGEAIREDQGVTLNTSIIDNGEVTDFLNCTFTQNQSENNVPTAAFNCSSNSSTVNTSITFTDCSNVNDGTWIWNFGDGITSNSRNTTHSYSSPGEYVVDFIVINSNNKMNSTNMVISIAD